MIGSWNMRGCIASETKRSDIGNVMLERKFVVLALSETKVKGKGECRFGSVVERVSGVENERAKEELALLLSKQVLDRVEQYWKVSAR